MRPQYKFLKKRAKKSVDFLVLCNYSACILNGKTKAEFFQPDS